MTEIITAEVRAAVERLRAANYWRSDPINGQYWDHDYYDQDASKAIDVLLSLLPAGMPEPVRCYGIAWDHGGLDIEGDEPFSGRLEKGCSVRGVFIPLERISTP